MEALLTPDAINGAFEAAGSVALMANVRRLLRDKKLAGVSWAPTVFFTAWGAWNLFYYPSLGQWFSFAGGCSVVAVNALWLILVAYFSRRAS